jgi:ankyrin repeat protein
MTAQNPVEPSAPNPMDPSTPDREAVLDLADRLFDAAREGNTEFLAAYVDAGAPVDLKNATGDSLLMLAAYHGQTETVRALLDRGADVNLANDRGQSPLAGSVFKGEDEILDLLLAAGADPALGRPSAVETADYFGKPELAARLRAATS